jgi:hypothetical protein
LQRRILFDTETTLRGIIRKMAQMGSLASANMDPLWRVGRENHVDQISFWLAVQHGGLPFKAAPSNVNYYIHFDGAHGYFDDARPIAMLHYHSFSLNVLGLLEPQAHLDTAAQAAVAKANAQIGNGFDNRLFWDLRYRHFRERGSGIGSRGDNLLISLSRNNQA